MFKEIENITEFKKKFSLFRHYKNDKICLFSNLDMCRRRFINSEYIIQLVIKAYLH